MRSSGMGPWVLFLGIAFLNYSHGLPCTWNKTLTQNERWQCGFICENPWGRQDPHYCGAMPEHCCCAPSCDIAKANSTAFIGVNWNDHYSKRALPREHQFQILKENGINHIKTFTPSGLAEIAHVYKSGKNVRVYVGIPNRELVPLASDTNYADSFVAERLAPYSEFIALVVVGNEPLICIRTPEWARNRECGSLNAPARLLPAMRNVQQALKKAGILLPVSTALNGGIMEMSRNPWTPCIADYRTAVKPILKQLWAFLREQSATLGAPAPFIVNVYTWFAAMQGSIPPRVACGLSDGVMGTPTDGMFNYYFNFDMQVDMQRVAMCKNNVTDLDLWIGETGWPSAGHVKATSENAYWYVENSVRRSKGQTLVNATNDNFRFRGVPFPVFIFEAFDEEKKYEIEHGNLFENSFGLFRENGVPKWRDENNMIKFDFPGKKRNVSPIVDDEL